MQSAVLAAPAAYALLAIYTLQHLLRTGRRGPRARARQVGMAILWPAYWMLVHGPTTIARRATAMFKSLAIRVIVTTKAVVWRVIRLPADAARATGHALCLLAAAVWRFAVGSVPTRYLRYYRMCRRGGLSRRRTIPYAWVLVASEAR